jgi:hypothetical protein
VSAGGIGTATANANATGGAGGDTTANFPGFSGIGTGGDGGGATAMAIASATGGGAAMADAVATGGAGGVGSGGGPPGATGTANATSTAQTTNGALAQARSTALGSSGQAQSSAKTRLAWVGIQSLASAPTGGDTATTEAIAEGGSGQAFANPGQTAYALSTALPGKAYATTQIGSARNVASALLAPRDAVFGTAILGANYASDGGGVSTAYSATSTFDFGYGGDLKLGLIAGQVTGFSSEEGFESMEFNLEADGVDILDVTFRNLDAAESFFNDNVINLGSDFGPNLDLNFGYTLVADGSGGFGFDFALGGAVPESSTWAMMLVGLVTLGYAGRRRTRGLRAA